MIAELQKVGKQGCSGVIKAWLNDIYVTQKITALRDWSMEVRCDHDVKKEKDKGLTMTRFGSEIGSFPDGCETNSPISHTACSFWIPFEF